MLLHLVHTKDDTQFKAIYKALERALWPINDYLEHVEQKVQPNLPVWPEPPVARQRTQQIGKSLVDIVEAVALEKHLYELFSGTGEITSNHRLPFIERYHKYFAERQWTTPLRDPADYYKGLFRLKPLDSENEKEQEIENTNYSKHTGDYCHFLNVIAAMARLIDYFSIKDNTIGILVKPGHISNETPSDRDVALAEVITYSNIPDFRVLKLMLAAFYHDLGKTVVYHRHAMEGASILAGHTSTALLQIGDIVKGYNQGWSFERDELLFVAGMVYYHDQFGTLSTGEAGYLRLVEIVDRFKRTSTIAGRDNRIRQIQLSNQHLFDLWLLNLADIIVSINDKWRCQGEWLSRDIANNIITNFMDSDKAKRLEHDFYIALNLLATHNETWHSDNLADLQESASKYANRHVVERIGRLIEASLFDLAGNTTKLVKSKFGDCRAVAILTKLDNLPRHTRENIILRCIQSVSNFAEFSARFAWIGQMDYALGFFRQIAERSLDRVVDQLCNSGPCTGWVNDNAVDPLDLDRRNHMDAEFLTDNFASTVVQILEYLLFREQDSNHLRNIEFEDASKRLTNEKIDKIIGMEGPYRSRRSIEFILQTIFIY